MCIPKDLRTRCRGHWRVTSNASLQLYVPSHRIRLMLAGARIASIEAATIRPSISTGIPPWCSGSRTKTGPGSIRYSTRSRAWTSGTWRRTPGSMPPAWHRSRSRRQPPGSRTSVGRRCWGGSRPATTPTSDGTPPPEHIACRIYWREAWTNDWRFQQTVGNVTQYMLRNVSTDDFVFGVAALGWGHGHEAWAAVYMTVSPRDPEVEDREVMPAPQPNRQPSRSLTKCRSASWCSRMGPARGTRGRADTA